MRKFKSAYNRGERVQKTFSEPSMAKQSFKDECDINNIMARFEKTGLVDHVNTHQGDYGDFTGAWDYHSSYNQILAAQAAFESLPAKMRARFGNQPGQFLEFVDDPENEDEMREMGLIPSVAPKEQPEEKDAPGKPPKAEAAPEAPPTGEKSPD